MSMPPDLLLRQVRALARFKRIRVSFDDAFRNAGTIIPSIQRLKLPIVIFVSTGYTRTGAPFTISELASDDPEDLNELRTMNWDDLRRLEDTGVEIGSHTVSHPHLPTLSDGELRDELSGSKAEIEDELGRPCIEFAYPYGEHDDRVRRAARAAGYERAYSLRGSRSDPFALPRMDLYRRHGVVAALARATLK
jgi:peptidoglycan/xylan/chitin deacetylase (PgdA/CDA1 family)